MKQLILLSLFLWVGQCNLNDSKAVFQCDYLGQKPPGIQPELFAPGIISTSEHEHSPLVITPEGHQIIWTVMPVPLGSGKQYFYQIVFDGEHWSQPSKIPFSIPVRCGSPVLSIDGNYLYYLERDLNGDEKISPKPQIVCRARRNGHQWGKRSVVTGLLPRAEGKVTMRFCFAGNQNLYYDLGGLSDDGSWEWEIWMREYRDRKYYTPVILGNGINDGNINWTPYVAPDESLLIFSSDRMNKGDSGDHYISFKKNDGSLSEPVNMKSINTPRQERFPVVTPDGKYLFFARNLPENHSEIFWISAKVIEELQLDEFKNFSGQSRFAMEY